ncbi:Ig-like domain repeat protein [Cohnella faecalis]|uniref:Ig-like domain repeat protein n=1 Tax=Cohnella faecalis TaxID=2315694 RepID=UPI0013142B06|nr:Ig-like domain repeat protein [Cohnella faecalis]
MRKSSLLTRKGLYTKCFLILVITYGSVFFSGEAYAANPVSVSLTGNAVTIAYGQSVTLSSTVTDTLGGSNSPVGTVTFVDNGTTIQTAQPLIEQTPEIIVEASPPGIIPSGYKQACMIDGRDNNPVGSPTCPVLKWGEYTFWGYSDTNNMGIFNIVQYNKEGVIINQDIFQSETRYLYKIELDNTNHTVSFVGQSEKRITVSINSLKAANSIASITTPPLSVGVHEFKAEFNSSDGNHDNEVSSTFKVNVSQITPSVSLTSSVPSSAYGERVSFEAEAPSVSGLVPSGDVIFYDGNVELGAVTLGNSGVTSAVYETSSLTPGVHMITVRYSGDNNFESRTSLPLTYTVNRIAANLSLTSSSSQLSYGSGVMFMVHVPAINLVPVTGTVTFKDGATLLCNVPIGTDGTAQCSAPLLLAGSHTITASYSGDSHYTDSTKSMLQTVNKIGSQINLNGLPSTVAVGDSVSVDVQVDTLGNVMPSGTVDIIIDDQTVSSPELEANASIHLNIPQLSVGSHKIEAAYRGTDNIESSVSTAQVINVLNNNADLSGIALSSGKLSPVFSTSITSYSANVANHVSSIVVTPNVYDSNATMTVNGAQVSNGQANKTINLSVGSNTITIVVKAQDGTLNTYSILVTREQESSSSGSDSSSTASNDTVISTDGTLKLPVNKTGLVSLGDSVQISIPANATDKELILTIEKLTDSLKLITKNDVLASPIFEILKNFSENFSNEISMTFAFDPNSLTDDQEPFVFYYDESKQVWVKVGGEVNGNTITVRVNHFTKFAVFGVGQASDPTSNTKQPTSFSDISGHWAEDNIKQAVSAGIVSGYQDGTFKPNRAVTRAEFAVMLMNALKPQGDEATLTFADKSKIGTWAQKSVMQAVYAGIITGYEDNMFRPDAEITRPEMATIIAKAMAQTVEEKIATGFVDDNYIPDWAKGAVAFMKNLGIIQGKGTNQFAPNDKTTRAEAVTVLLRMVEQRAART